MEELLSIPVGSENIRGVIHHPDASLPAERAIIFLHGWSGNRQGPHRMFVELARRLSRQGSHGLRFDFRGRGESDGQVAKASIQAMTEDVAAILNFVEQRLRPKEIYLVAICSGSKVAIRAAAADSRIDGLALWSAEAMGYLRGTTAKAHKTWYALLSYVKKLTHPATWRKIMTFKVNMKMVSKAVCTPESADQKEVREESMALERFKDFAGPILFVYGSNDPDTRIAAGSYVNFCRDNGIRYDLHEIAGANHSFYSLEWARKVQELTQDWLQRVSMEKNEGGPERQVHA